MCKKSHTFELLAKIVVCLTPVYLKLRQTRDLNPCLPQASLVSGEGCSVALFLQEVLLFGTFTLGELFPGDAVNPARFAKFPHVGYSPDDPNSRAADYEPVG